MGTDDQHESQRFLLADVLTAHLINVLNVRLAHGALLKNFWSSKKVLPNVQFPVASR